MFSPSLHSQCFPFYFCFYFSNLFGSCFYFPLIRLISILYSCMLCMLQTLISQELLSQLHSLVFLLIGIRFALIIKKCWKNQKNKKNPTPYLFFKKSKKKLLSRKLLIHTFKMARSSKNVGFLPYYVF